MERVLLLLLYSSLVTVSQQEIVKVTASPSSLDEHATLTLKCVADPEHTIFKWILDENVIVTHEGTNTELLQGKDPVNYLVRLSPNGSGKMVFCLTIQHVSRYDDGRWTCLVGPSPDESRKVVNVNYAPDDQYPLCTIAFGELPLPTCVTQEGKPKVALTWVDITGNNTDSLRERANVPNLAEKTFTSTVDLTSVKPPVGRRDSLACKIVQGGQSRSCYFPKEDFYNNTNISITTISSENTFICSVDPPYYRSNLAWDWSAEGLLSVNKTSGLNSTVVTFTDPDFAFNGTAVRCLLRWGIFDHKQATAIILVDKPTTNLPNLPRSTGAAVANTEPSKATAAETKGEQPVTKSTDTDTRGVHRPRPTKSKNPESVTKRPTTNSFSVAFFDQTTDYYDYEEEEITGGMNVLILIIIIFVVVILLILVIMVCVCCCVKKKTTSTVV